MELKGRRGRRSKHLLNDLKEKTVYWKLKEDSLDLDYVENVLGKDCRLVRQTME
jgi:hypothetical protein